MAMEAHVLTLNDFNRPKVYTDADSAYMHIVYLLLLEPGKFQSHPNMGIGLRSRYRHNNETDFLYTLRDDISTQIQAYLPELTLVDVTVSILADHVLGIVIDTSTGSYTLAYDDDENVMTAGATYVLDDL